MPDKNNTLSGSSVLDMRIWCRYMNTCYKVKCTAENSEQKLQLNLY